MTKRSSTLLIGSKTSYKHGDQRGHKLLYVLHGTRHNRASKRFKFLSYQNIHRQRIHAGTAQHVKTIHIRTEKGAKKVIKSEPPSPIPTTTLLPTTKCSKSLQNPLQRRITSRRRRFTRVHPVLTREGARDVDPRVRPRSQRMADAGSCACLACVEGE